MLARVHSLGIQGIEAFRVEVEVDLAGGLPCFAIVGLPDASIRESTDRVKAAIKNSGFEFPRSRLTVNLAPGNVRKEGPAFDLPIALGILAAIGKIPQAALEGYCFCGELSLKGELRPILGALSRAIGLKGRKMGLVVPQSNANEASIIRDVKVYTARHLLDCVKSLQGEEVLPQTRPDVKRLWSENGHLLLNFKDVKGQLHAKRGLEVAAAGAHHVLLIGPAGTGKTMLARRLPSIFSPMSVEEAIETTQIHSVVGLLSNRRRFVVSRPFRSPHHTISDAGLVGGGSKPKPGEISLAHHGVLFLDELPEFKRPALEALRQPLEEEVITISRAEGSLTYPAQFMLIGAMNPCPCGFLTDKMRECHCSPSQIRNYLSRISGSLLDRIDIHLEVAPLSYEELHSFREGECSEAIRKRVVVARKRQSKRYQSFGKGFWNASLGPQEIKRYCSVTREAQELLKQSIQRLGLSARAYDKILKVGKTIADLEGADEISAIHLSEAIGYRSLDRGPWGMRV